MCKLFIVPHSQDSDMLKKLAETAAPIISESDKDGIGYVALTRRNQPVVEKWLDPKDAFKKRRNPTLAEQCFFGRAEEAFDLKDGVGYEYHGNLDQPIKMLLMHSRMATCGVSMDNVHPFRAWNTWLSHNGIIYSSTEKKYPQVNSSCDSESILKAYCAHKVARYPKRVQGFSDSVEGNFAVAALTRQDANRRVTWTLDVIKDNRTELYAAWSDVMNGPVYCTNKMYLYRIFKKMEWDMGCLYEVKDNCLTRFNACTGRAMTVIKFTREYSSTINNAWDEWDSENVGYNGDKIKFGNKYKQTSFAGTGRYGTVVSKK